VGIKHGYEGVTYGKLRFKLVKNHEIKWVSGFFCSCQAMERSLISESFWELTCRPGKLALLIHNLTISEASEVEPNTTGRTPFDSDSS
jgi:hypothetical protein